MSAHFEITELTESPSLKPARVFWKWFKRVVIVLALVAFAAAAGFYAASEIYTGSIGPGIKIGPFKVARMDQETVRSMLYAKVDSLIDQGIDVIYKDEMTNISLSSRGATDPDVTQDYVIFEIEQAIEQAYHNYHHSNPLVDAYLLATAFIIKPTIEIPTTVNHEVIYEKIIS